MASDERSASRKARGSASTPSAKRPRKGANCSSACLTRDHRSWGECVRSKGLQVSPAVNDEYATKQRAWDKELNNYESATRQGLNPAGTKQHHVDAAIREAEGG